jgi:hypothetical protein
MATCAVCHKEVTNLFEGSKWCKPCVLAELDRQTREQYSAEPSEVIVAGEKPKRGKPTDFTLTYVDVLEPEWDKVS